MKLVYRILNILLVLLFGVNIGVVQFGSEFPHTDAQGYDIKVMTFNVYISGVGDRSPENRGERVANTIRSEMPDSFGLQEANLAWVERVGNALPEYAYVGVGRDDGDKKGEFSPVFYLKDRYDVIDSGTFWFSPTPDKPSRGWDAMCRRICSWAILQNKTSGEKYAHFNVHFDNIGTISRKNSADILLERIDEYAKNIRTVITGDFNCKEGTTAYEKIVNGGFADTKRNAEQTMSGATWHNFGVNSTKGSPIDFIFVTRGMASVKSYKIITDKIDGDYPSDHFPVVSEMTLLNEPVGEQLRVMSYNIWNELSHKTVSERVSGVAGTICAVAPDVFGLQEAEYDWMLSLNSALGEVYGSVGAAREGEKDGQYNEYNPVFYRRDRFKLIDSGTFWLSDTPDVPSKIEGSACKRICTYAVLEVRASGKRFVAMNTHLDHVGEAARHSQMGIVLDRAEEFDLPVVLTGDMNAKPTSACCMQPAAHGFTDARATAPDTDMTATFPSSSAVIDYVFAKDFTALKFDVVEELKGCNAKTSDHLAVYADLQF